MGIAPPFATQAVVFDLDGLLVDSEVAWGRAERRVVTELGHPWDEAVRELMLGRGPEESAAVLNAHLEGRHDPGELRRRLQAAVSEEFARGLRPQPGAAQLVDALGAAVPIAVATNSVRALADQILEAAGLAGRFAAVVCADEVAAPKPAPDVYVSAAEACGAAPDRCVALEDSPVGVTAAKGAGMWVIGCSSVRGQRLDAADAVVTTLTELAAADLLDGLAQASSWRGVRGRRDRPT